MGISAIAIWPRYMAATSPEQRQFKMGPPPVGHLAARRARDEQVRRWLDGRPVNGASGQSGAAMPPWVCSRSTHACAAPSASTKYCALNVTHAVTTDDSGGSPSR
jgi:hypothetical protein